MWSRRDLNPRTAGHNAKLTDIQMFKIEPTDTVMCNTALQQASLSQTSGFLTAQSKHRLNQICIDSVIELSSKSLAHNFDLEGGGRDDPLDCKVLSWNS